MAEAQPQPQASRTTVFVNKPEASISLTATELKDMMIAFAQELRKPTPEQEEEARQRKAILERAKRDKLELVRIEIEAKKQREEGCAHKKQNGESTVMGQKHSDGKVHPICIRCQKEFEPFKLRSEQEDDVD